MRAASRDPGLAPVARWSGCAGQGLFHRSDSEGCSLRATVGEGIWLCIPRALASRWLSHGGPNCGEWSGQWREFSPPLNEPVGGHAKLRTRIFRVSGLPDPSQSSFAVPGWIAWTARARWRIERARARMDSWIGAHERSGVLRELVTGTRRPGGALGLLGTLGFVHLLFASGLHLYALTRLWGALAHVLLRQAPGISAARGRDLSLVLAALSWTIAWLLAGARPGMLRPWIIVCLRTGAGRAGVRWRRLAPLILALVLDAAVGAWRGDLSWHSGRWIYALALGGALIARSPLGMAIGAWILAAWLEWWGTGTLALATPLLSAVTVPLHAAVLYPLTLAAGALRAIGAMTASSTLFAAVGSGSDLAAEYLARTAMASDSVWSLSPAAALAGCALGAATMASAAWPRARRAAILGLIAMVAFARLGPDDSRAASDGDGSAVRARAVATRVEQLDIGQGDAALVASVDGTHGLIDAGSERALGERDWLQLLARRGITAVDWIALTHLDEDHAGGVLRLARLLPIRCVASSPEQWSSERGQHLRAELRALGVRVTDWQRAQGGCVPFPVLGPGDSVDEKVPSGESRRYRRRPASRGNSDMSAILVPLERGGFFLSAGDADETAEPRIGRWAAQLARSLPSGPRILKVSHHGSRTSSAREFLRKIAPTEAWVSSGLGNRYGHPSVQALGRLEVLGIPIRRTDRSGSLRWPPDR